MINIDTILLEKFNVKSRFVEVKDAEFLLSLRTNQRLGRFLSKTENNLENQINWIEAYKVREKNNLEFYFIFDNLEGEKYGVSRIYNFDEKSFEIGSWLFSQNSPLGVSVLADLTTRDFAFEKFKFDYCRFEVRKENLSVVNYHKRFNPELINEDELNYYFKLTKDNYYLFREKLIKLYKRGN